MIAAVKTVLLSNSYLGKLNQIHCDTTIIIKEQCIFSCVCKCVLGDDDDNDDCSERRKYVLSACNVLTCTSSTAKLSHCCR